MPAALRSLSATTYASRTNTTITAPAGIVNGDVLLMMLTIGAVGTPPTPTLPSGFSILQGPTTQTDGSFQVTRYLARKVASSESGSYTATHASASSDGVILCVSGADISTLVSSDNGGGGGGTTTTALSVTTTTDSSLVAFLVHNWQLYGSASPPTGTTPTFTENQDSASSLIYVATGVLATAGATGNKTHNNLNSSPGDSWGAFLVAVGPSAGSTYTLTAAAGSFSETGVSASLTRSRLLASSVGAFSETGIAAALKRGLRVTSASGAFALNGQATNLITGRKLSAAVGVFVETGFAATLNYVGSGVNYTLSASTGSFTETGRAAGFLVGHRLTAVAGVYTLNGSPVALTYSGAAPTAPAHGGRSRKRYDNDIFNSRRAFKHDKEVDDNPIIEVEVMAVPPRKVAPAVVTVNRTTPAILSQALIGATELPMPVPVIAPSVVLTALAKLRAQPVVAVAFDFDADDTEAIQIAIDVLFGEGV